MAVPLSGGRGERWGAAVPPFLAKSYEMVNEPTTDAVVSWGPANNSFVVWNAAEFARNILPKHFKHSNFSSFVRQLNTYGFRKIDPDRWEFAHEGFLRGQKHLLTTIMRHKPLLPQAQPLLQHQPQKGTVPAACDIEVGRVGFEEKIQILKKDKNVLMQEVVRLRQQQEAADHQVQTVGKRLQEMEQRQQQMMAFLAKVMHSPGFCAQFVQQSEGWLAPVSKRRRLPNQENSVTESTDGQKIKCQPLIKEKAKAMLMKALNYDSPIKLETLIENFASSDGHNLDLLPTVPTAADATKVELTIPETAATADLPDQGNGETDKFLTTTVESFWEKFLKTAPCSTGELEEAKAIQSAWNGAILMQNLARPTTSLLSSLPELAIPEL